MPNTTSSKRCSFWHAMKAFKFINLMKRKRGYNLLRGSGDVRRNYIHVAGVGKVKL